MKLVSEILVFLTCICGTAFSQTQAVDVVPAGGHSADNSAPLSQEIASSLAMTANETTNREPETANREPETVNLEPRIINREPETVNREPGITNLESTGDHEPGTRNKELGTRNKELGTRNKELGTRNKEPGTRNKEPGTIRQLPKIATGADGFVEVVAADVPGDPVGFRLPVLQFTTRLIRDVERVYGLEMPRGKVGLIIHAQDGMTNDVRVISKSGIRDGAACTDIWLPSPGYSNIDALRYAIVKGYLRCWIDRNRPAGVSPRQAAEIPQWLVMGAMRTLSTETIDDDKRTVLTMWSEARLPYFPVLCRDLRAGVGEKGAVCGYIVSWMREAKLFKKFLQDLAAGTTINGSRLASELTGEKDPDKQDRASDERLARLTRAVLSPGKASSWDLKVFTSRLLLYSAEFDRNIKAMGTSCTFREAIAISADNPAIREAAGRKAREMLFCAIGRGPALAAVAESYRLFLAALARGEAPGELGRLLDEAEMQLQEILDEDRKNDNR